MDYTVTQVQNVLRNYESILSKKRLAPPVEELPSKQNAPSDRVSVSKEALKMLEEMQSVNLVNKQPKPEPGLENNVIGTNSHGISAELLV
jgi:hypothetical protein